MSTVQSHAMMHPYWAPSLTAQSIVDTLMYMAKNSHPILHRLGLQHIRVARSRDCANDFSGCKHRFQFVSEQSPVNAEKHLRQGVCHPHTLTCLVAYMVCCVIPYPVSGLCSHIHFTIKLLLCILIPHCRSSAFVFAGRLSPKRPS